MVLATAGVTVRYGTEFVRIEQVVEGQHVAVVQQQQQQQHEQRHEQRHEQQHEDQGDNGASVATLSRLPFALLVGADGGRSSAVREAMGAEYLPQERFDLVRSKTKQKRALFRFEWFSARSDMHVTVTIAGSGRM